MARSIPRIRLLPESHTYALPGSVDRSTTTPPGLNTLNGTTSYGVASEKSGCPRMTSAQRSPATPRTGSTGTGVTRFCAWTVPGRAGKISGAQPRNHRQQTRCHRQPKLNPLQHLFNLRRLLSIENLTALRRQSSIRTRLHLVPLSPNTTPYRRCAPNSSFPNPNRGTGGVEGHATTPRPAPRP